MRVNKVIQDQLNMFYHISMNGFKRVSAICFAFFHPFLDILIGLSINGLNNLESPLNRRKNSFIYCSELH